MKTHLSSVHRVSVAPPSRRIPRSGTYTAVHPDSGLPLSSVRPVDADSEQEAAVAMHAPEWANIVPAGKTACARSAYRRVIQTIHMLPEFDRIQVIALSGAPAGTVSVVLMHLERAGYIVRTGRRAVHDQLSPMVPGELGLGVRPEARVVGHITFVKSDTWDKLGEYFQ